MTNPETSSIASLHTLGIWFYSEEGRTRQNGNTRCSHSKTEYVGIFRLFVDQGNYLFKVKLKSPQCLTPLQNTAEINLSLTLVRLTLTGDFW